jgi:dTDP-4-amino-4,6-dideoxy-D-galactose acyltransferase
MSLVYLEWDSDFFDMKIGKIEMEDLDVLKFQSDVACAKREGYELIYLFGEPKFAPSLVSLRGAHCVSVGTNNLYSKPVLSGQQNKAITLLPRSTDIKDVYELAYESGKYSRFRLDPHIGLASFHRLYRAWVDNSVSGVIADDVLVFIESNVIQGLCTVRFAGEGATVGLLAVAPRQQGNGVGRALVEFAERRALQRGCQRLYVTTQVANEGACVFYEKLGMTMFRSTKIHHLWIRNDSV